MGLEAVYFDSRFKKGSQEHLEKKDESFLEHANEMA